MTQKGAPCKLDLDRVLVHTSTSLYVGHYMTYRFVSLGGKAKQWYLFNDGCKVKSVSAATVMGKTESAFLLRYRRAAATAKP